MVVCLGLGVVVVVWCCIGGRLDDVGCLYGEFGVGCCLCLCFGFGLFF